MTHLHWAFLPRSDVQRFRHIEDITARCGAIVGLKDIAEDWGECRCNECLKFWRVQRLAEMNRADR